MERVNTHYFICTKGHLTMGQSKKKTICDQKIQQVRLVKKGKAKVEKEVLQESTCGEEIKIVKEIPETLDLTELWDYDTIKAFMSNQTHENLKIKFIECLQKHMHSMNNNIIDLRSALDELIREKA